MIELNYILFPKMSISKIKYILKPNMHSLIGMVNLKTSTVQFIAKFCRKYAQGLQKYAERLFKYAHD